MKKILFLVFALVLVFMTTSSGIAEPTNRPALIDSKLPFATNESKLCSAHLESLDTTLEDPSREEEYLAQIIDRAKAVDEMEKEWGEIPSKPSSSKTKSLARDVINLLLGSNFSFDPSLGRDVGECYRSLKIGHPLVAEFESISDSSLALLELYEEYDSALTIEDYISMNRNRQRGTEDESYFWRSEDPEGYTLWKLPNMIEGLLSFEQYFPRFDAEARLRFTTAFTSIHKKITKANIEVFGSDIDEIKFLQLGGSRYLDNISNYKHESNYASRSVPIDDTEHYWYNYVSTTPAYTTNGTTVPAKKAQWDYSNAKKTIMRNQIENIFSGLTFKRLGSTCYNCHSYAWYSTSSSNMKWIDLIDSNYRTDPHAQLVSTTLSNTSNVQAGDKVVYLDLDEQDNLYAAHSGIVITASSNPDNVVIQSKWGQNCVWRHKLKNVPDEYKLSQTTVYFRFYRYSTSHSYTQYTSYNNAKHKVTCSICGDHYLEPHVFVNNPSTCDLCGFHSPRGKTTPETTIHNHIR